MTEYSWVVEIITPQMIMPLKVEIDNEIVIGRGSPGQANAPDIDLGPYGAEESGVSRQHLALVIDHDRLTAVDLNTGNGTYLNGQRLQANKPYRLNSENQLYLGHLPLEIRIVMSPHQGSGLHANPAVRLDTASPLRPGEGELILVVEDDPELAKIFSRLMKDEGYRTVQTHEVVGAIRVYNRERPSLILLDLMLPDMSGLEFCRYVRRDVVKNTIPIVVVSADTSSIDAALKAGADVFLRKPFSIQELRHVVSAMILRHQHGEVTHQTKQLVGTAPLASVPVAARPHSVVLYVAGFGDSPITVSVEDRISFGRTPGTGALQSHIDLTRFDAADVGVSRVHMFLHRKGQNFFVEDANSTNGTYKNGFPLDPGQLVPVKNGDEIRLGMLRMYIYFLEDEESV
jgi:CheY-like chemotaxis protein/pSer/pThr/pTyr-binding forkhead associated (FHA) protein